ncbi:CRISPR-associated Cas5 family protein [Corynebacterium kutscheri]|uniref:CRISPR-associated Cas5 family protein n=1 Tax=Corynebacterium kutscheri TaxID=35755 RepID=A0A0F6QZB7_9CORY|nr:type I-E CRISPR-associated protein Cas5/CasD [Corynebacterium kutscheri]AKE41057.1 CRISPR-associated protein Cas5 [Corynebacterium kutscheri]VEH06946.1 CRISPR-associated Cas5 family protein [Corynebacterium kutscheri]VEH09359.1 CRISPR-associated Cas5 family protein [Corynebacterium kutscheri]VEH79441.1 CRISPR-associated Cas5 family protein [Corynebacterium kutscheri]
MSVLLLKLAGPLQSWGDHSRFMHRDTRREPTKSGVIGLLAAAQGRLRTDTITDLAELRFGVRTDQIGTVISDFQTEIDWRNREAEPLTHRDYLADAIFVAAVEGSTSVITELAEAVKSPKFPLFLGRRACPPSGQLLIGIKENSLVECLENEKWHASCWYKKKQPKKVQLRLSYDAHGDDPISEMVSDVPKSFDLKNREYGVRAVTHRFTSDIDNPKGWEMKDHNPFTLLGDA